MLANISRIFPSSGDGEGDGDGDGDGDGGGGGVVPLLALFHSFSCVAFIKGTEMYRSIMLMMAIITSTCWRN